MSIDDEYAETLDPNRNRIGNLMSDLSKTIPKNEHQKESSEERVWSEADLWVEIPEEFHGAELSQGLKEVLTRRPPSVTVLGPPGTGKTRSLWAMKYCARRALIGDLIGSPIKRNYIPDGQYERRICSYDDAIIKIIEKNERVEITDEAGGIRAHRYDRGWLDDLISFPYFLCVDDIGCLEPNEWVKEVIYHLSNERRARKRTTIWTSNLTSQQFRDTFGGAIASRILGGEVIEVSGQDWRLK
jgi:hypothetical protein